MKPFFLQLTADPVVVDIRKIIPTGDTPDEIRKQAVYFGLVRKLPTFLPAEVRNLICSMLRPFHEPAMSGALDHSHYRRLLDTFNFFRENFLDRFDAFTAYKTINCSAMLIALQLFVDNCTKEQIMRLSAPQNLVAVEDLTRQIATLYADQDAPIHPADARFYAHYFTVQALFDQLFIADGEVVRYGENGAPELIGGYVRLCSYTELSNRKLVTAGDAERALCYALTTGWGEGIDVDTWNLLNQDYYSMSDDNFFSADYDSHLEKLIPQFAYARVRAAESIAAAWDEKKPLNLVEVGAGSGAFAACVFMALKHAGKDLSRFSYKGLEPSMLRTVYADNFANRTGQQPPDDWAVEKGSLESFLETYRDHIQEGAENVYLQSYSIHHCYGPSVARLLGNPEIQQCYDKVYVLDGLSEHGWTKMNYMPLDCRSPENFDNCAVTGIWQARVLWHEPEEVLEHHAVNRGWAVLRELTPPRLNLGENFGLVIDLDGTIYHDKEAIPGAIDFLKHLDAQEIPYLLMTNRTDRTPTEVQKMLAGFGAADIASERIYTAAHAAAECLEPGNAVIIGTHAIEEALTEKGFTLNDHPVDYVVVGRDPGLTYDKLTRAVQGVLNGARFVATNTDRLMNVASGFAPGTGATVAAIQTATGVDPLVVGKPKPYMFLTAAKRLGLPPGQVVMIGDNLETDIQGARDAGLQTVLVLTGVADAETVAASGIEPDVILPDLTSLRFN